MEIVERNIGAYLKRLSLYFAVLVLFWAISLFWWLSYGYTETFLWLNQHHWWLLDQADLYFFTHLGDGLILPGLMVLFFWRKHPGLVVTGVIAMLFWGVMSQVGKSMIFTDWYRPVRALEALPDLVLVHPHPPRSHSFPSGHATTMASGGVFFAYYFYSLRKWLPLVVGLFTVFLCFTRVVIGVHFPGDIFVGSMLGSIGGFLFLWLFYPRFAVWLKRLREGDFPWITNGVLAVAILAVLGQFVYLIMNT